MGEAAGDLRGLAMVCFAEVMRAVDPLPKFFAKVLEVADDIVEDEVAGAVVEAKYWLVGAYSSIFGDSGANDNNTDSFKLASITTQTPDPKPPTEVAEPSTIAMFASFGLFLMWRRKRSA